MMNLPLAAGGIPGAIVDLFVVLLAAKLGDELFRWLRQPTIVGEILAGVLIGPSVLGLVEPTETLRVFAELGVVFLLFWVGLETKLSDLAGVGRSALLVGVLGIAFPFAGGMVFAAGLGESTSTQIFVASALVATSVGITSAVLVQLGVIGSVPARTVLGAAVVDDILAMLLLAIAAGVAGTGGVDAAEIAVVLGLALAFVAFFALGGTRLLRAQPQLLTVPRFAESPLLPSVLLCLGLAALAAWVGLAAVIGAFLAGMMVAETKEQHAIEEEVAPLYAFFPPFFFAFIGIELDLDSLASLGPLLTLAGLTVIAVVTKFGGAWLGAFRSLGRRPASFVGVGMIPRGEVGIIVAGIGSEAGVIDEELFAIIVAMSIATTLVAPPLLAWLAPPPAPPSARPP